MTIQVSTAKVFLFPELVQMVPFFKLSSAFVRSEAAEIQGGLHIKIWECNVKVDEAIQKQLVPQLGKTDFF